MNWFTANKLFSSLLVIIAIAVLALGYLTFAARGKYGEAVDSYGTGMQKLSQLRSLTPYRNEENLLKKREQVDNFRTLTSELQADLVKNQGEIAAVEPAAFQARLRELVLKTVENAKQRGVELPEKFYLGFEKYESELPTNAVAGLLNWQLTAIDSIVNRLVDLKVTKIDDIIRTPLPGEIAPEVPAKEAPLLRKYPFEVVFTGYAGNLQSILNSLVTLPPFTITRMVRTENEQLKSPLRPSAVGAPLDPSLPATTEPAVDKIVIGKERITSSVVIDLVQFTPKPLAKK